MALKHDREVPRYFEGVCNGGPLHGQMRVHDKAVLHIAVTDASAGQLNDPAVVKVENHTYVHRFGMWHHQEKKL